MRALPRCGASLRRGCRVATSARRTLVRRPPRTPVWPGALRLRPRAPRAADAGPARTRARAAEALQRAPALQPARGLLAARAAARVPRVAGEAARLLRR